MFFAWDTVPWWLICIVSWHVSRAHIVVMSCSFHYVMFFGGFWRIDDICVLKWSVERDHMKRGRKSSIGGSHHPIRKGQFGGWPTMHLWGVWPTHKVTSQHWTVVPRGRCNRPIEDFLVKGSLFLCSIGTCIVVGLLL